MKRKKAFQICFIISLCFTVGFLSLSIIQSTEQQSINISSKNIIDNSYTVNQTNYELLTTGYDGIVDKCDLPAEQKQHISASIYEAQKQEILMNDSNKARQILAKVGEELSNCTLKPTPSPFYDSKVQTVISFASTIFFGILGLRK